MKFNRPLLAAAYLVAALMIVMPMLEVGLSVWPVRAGQTSWRFGTVGLLSQAVMTPLLGILLLTGLALALGQRRLLLVTSILTAVLGLKLLAIVPLFALDAIQMRVQVRPDAHRAFDLSALLAAIKLMAVLVVSILVAVGTWKARKQLRRAVPSGREESIIAR
jgi:hypothetical protein